MKFTWLRRDEEHPELGLLVTGQTYDAPADQAAGWIKQGAAAPADEPQDVPAAPAAAEQEG